MIKFLKLIISSLLFHSFVYICQLSLLQSLSSREIDLRTQGFNQSAGGVSFPSRVNIANNILASYIDYIFLFKSKG